MCRLLLGDMPAGWLGFEYRWDSPLMAADRRDFGRPRWSGGAGGPVLLFAEQGFGDTLPFARYVPVVADRVGAADPVILEVQPALVRLMRRLDPRIEVIARGDRLPEFDRQCPLMSLPRALGQPFPHYSGPHLRADAAAVAVWRTRLAAYPGRKVGLGVPVWILNRFDTCWRWMLGRSDSPWYATARLFRQPAMGAWDEVVASVARRLATQPPWNDVP